MISSRCKDLAASFAIVNVVVLGACRRRQIGVATEVITQDGDHEIIISKGGINYGVVIKRISSRCIRGPIS
jgi:hypothetical protein